MDVSAYFDDAEGGALNYQVATSNATVVTVSIAGSVVTLTAASVGSVVVVVTAIDSGGLAVQQGFEVAAPAPPLVGLAADNLAAPESGGAVFALVLSALTASVRTAARQDAAWPASGSARAASAGSRPQRHGARNSYGLPEKRLDIRRTKFYAAHRAPSARTQAQKHRTEAPAHTAPWRMLSG